MIPRSSPPLDWDSTYVWCVVRGPLRTTFLRAYFGCSALWSVKCLEMYWPTDQTSVHLSDREGCGPQKGAETHTTSSLRRTMTNIIESNIWTNGLRPKRNMFGCEGSENGLKSTREELRNASIASICTRAGHHAPLSVCSILLPLVWRLAWPWSTQPYQRDIIEAVF